MTGSALALGLAGMMTLWFTVLDVRRIISGRATWAYIIISSLMLGVLWGLWLILALEAQ
jgi:hypothetical protein